MFEFIRGEIAKTAGSYPAFDAEALAAVARTVQEPILASGPSYLRETLLGNAATSVLGLYAVIACMAWFALLAAVAFLREWRAGRRVEHRMLGTLGSAGFVAALLCGFVGMMAHLSAQEEAREGYILTASRVIALDGKGKRTDIPASAIVGVVREKDGVRVTLQRVTGGTVVIEAAAADRAALDAAIGRLAAARDAGNLLSDVARGG